MLMIQQPVRRWVRWTAKSWTVAPFASTKPTIVALVAAAVAVTAVAVVIVAAAAAVAGKRPQLSYTGAHKAPVCLSSLSTRKFSSSP